jgi:hypothetical protein
MPNRNIEIEAKFVVIGPDPQSIFRRIAEAGSIVGYAIEPKGSDTIEDVYFDTEDYLLRLRKWALRLRTTGGQTLITLKGPGESIGDGIISRFEFEKPWSEESFLFICEILRVRGIIEVANIGSGFDAPKKILSASGFGIVHERVTTRRSLDIIAAEVAQSQEAPHAPTIPAGKIAELDFDETRFSLGDIEALHYEIEIEAMSEAGISSLKAVSQWLIREYPDELIPWKHSKLATAKAIGELFSRGLLKAPQGRTLCPGLDDYVTLAKIAGE